MNRLTLTATFIGLLSSLLLNLFETGYANGEDTDPRLEKVFADWQDRQHWFDAIEFWATGLHFVPRGSYTDSLPPIMSHLKPGEINPKTDLEGPIEIKLLLDLKNGRYRSGHRDQQFYMNIGEMKPFVSKETFNGAMIKSCVPKDENLKSLNVNVTQPELTIVSGNMENGKFQTNFHPIFFAIGRISTFTEPILPGKFRNRPDISTFYVHGTGVHDKRECLILRTKPLGDFVSFQEFWVDVARESAIVRCTTYQDTSPTEEISIQNKISQGHWLPENWRWTVFSQQGQGNVLYLEKMVVKKVALDPAISDGDFDMEMEIKSGTMVEERTDHETRNRFEIPKSDVSIYRIGKDGEKIFVPDPYRRDGDQYSPPSTTFGWVWGFWALVLTSMSVYFLLWLRRRGSSND